MRTLLIDSLGERFMHFFHYIFIVFRHIFLFDKVMIMCKTLKVCFMISFYLYHYCNLIGINVVTF